MVGARYSLSDQSEIVLLSFSEAGYVCDFFEQIASEQRWEVPPGGIHKYAGHSVYFVHERDGELLGAIKLVVGSDEGLPLLETWPECALRGRGDVADLSLLALSRRARASFSSFLPLSAEMWRYCVLNGINELWTALEPWRETAYRRFGWPFESAGPLRPYWGDPMRPCRMGIIDAGREYHRRASRSKRYRLAYDQAVRDIPESVRSSL